MLQTLLTIGDRPDDPEHVRLQHRLLISMALLMSVGGLTWGAMGSMVGLFWPTVIPLSYTVFTVLNMLLFKATKNFSLVRFLQVSMSLLLPFAFQLSLGGFHTSGAGILWSMLAILAALTFSEIRQGARWLAAFCVLAILAGGLDSSLPRPDLQDGVLTVFFVVNIVAITSIVFGMTMWLLNQRNLAVRTATQANLALAETNDELKMALEAAHTATEAKSRFLSNMSHELRTPLNAVLGMTEMLEDTPLTPEQQAYLDTARFSGKALLGIISDVLDLAKIEAGELRIDRVETEVRPVLRQTVDLFMVQAAAKGIELTLDVAPKVPLAVDIDETRWVQILMNLLSNALKFTERGSIQLVVMAHPDGLICQVQDTGIGIAPDVVQRLAQPFIQADASITRRFGGTGLGLAITQHLVQLHGGQLRISSTLGVGSSFEVWLNAPPVAVPTRQRAPSLGPLPRRVLLVEDNPVNQAVATAMLKRLGVEHTVASNGEQALEALDEVEFDVILMDMMMPVMDGLEATRRLRKMNLPRRPIVVAMTANASQADREHCREAGMDFFLAKPVTVQMLRSVLTQAARVRRTPRD